MKYEMTYSRKQVVMKTGNSEVKQIRALKDIPNIGVKEGDLGGFIYDESCLSQKGDCWVFQGSVVHKDSAVRGNAKVWGNSIIGTGSIVRGDSQVEDSNILNSSLVDDKASVESSRVLGQSIVNGEVLIRNATLSGISIEKGEILDSKLICANGFLTIKSTCTIWQSNLRLTGNNSVLEQDCWMDKVECLNFERFHMEGKFRMEQVNFPEGTKLTVKAVVDEAACSFVRGLEGCEFRNLNLTLKNTQIIGAVTLNGNLVLTDCIVEDMASIINETERNLSIEKVTMKELGTIYKKKITGDSSAYGLLVKNDMVVEL